MVPRVGRSLKDLLAVKGGFKVTGYTGSKFIVIFISYESTDGTQELVVKIFPFDKLSNY